MAPGFNPRRKRSRSLIDLSMGDLFNCANCEARPVFIVHYHYRDFKPLEGLSSEAADKFKRFDQVVDRQFLCRAHWAAEFFNNPAYFDPHTGEATFSSVDPQTWKKIDYKELEPILAQMRDMLELKS